MSPHKINYHKKEVISTFLGLNENITTKLFHFDTSIAKFIGPYFGCQLIIEPYQSNSPNINEYIQKDFINENNHKINSNNQKNFQINELSHQNININCLNTFLNYEFTEKAMNTNQTRAIIISHKNEIIYENYQNLFIYYLLLYYLLILILLTKLIYYINLITMSLLFICRK